MCNLSSFLRHSDRQTFCESIQGFNGGKHRIWKEINGKVWYDISVIFFSIFQRTLCWIIEIKTHWLICYLQKRVHMNNPAKQRLFPLSRYYCYTINRERTIKIMQNKSWTSGVIEKHKTFFSQHYKIWMIEMSKTGLINSK